MKPGDKQNKMPGLQNLRKSSSVGSGSLRRPAVREKGDPQRPSMGEEAYGGHH